VRRLVGVLLGAVLAASSCTGEPAPPPVGTSAPGSTAACLPFVLDRNGGTCVDTLELDGSTYRVQCVAVPEVLLDVPVPARWGRSAVRTIAAVPATQALAVTGTGDRCGSHPLALRTDLSEDTAAAIIEEVERGASLPPDLEKDPAAAE
jgi:hypothetical protein